jgi:anti-sigma factor RsiW
MACDSWRSKIEAYADAELSTDDMRAMGDHLRPCASCTLDLLGRVQLKRAIKTAGTRFSPSLALRQRVEKELSARNTPIPLWNWMPKPAAAAALVVVAFLLFYGWSSSQQGQTFAELTDLHVATLASSTPVDVLSRENFHLPLTFLSSPTLRLLSKAGGSPIWIKLRAPN